MFCLSFIVCVCGYLKVYVYLWCAIMYVYVLNLLLNKPFRNKTRKGSNCRVNESKYALQGDIAVHENSLISFVP